MTKKVALFNTLTRKIEPFVPLQEGKVSLYTCGPTVYHYAHIGNLRTYVFEDLLVRTLKRAGFDINHVMNITDVGHLVSDGDDGEDKMEVGSRRAGKTAWEIADYYTKVFFTDLQKLNVTSPHLIPKATDHVPEMIALVENLEKKGFVYKTSDGVYFETAKFPSYAKFAKLDAENLEAGKRVAMGDKKSPTDFALWKFSSPGEKRQMEWDSPWGKGFPGWHIECSAMAMKYLGETFDIHCGGIDHIPVHHTNEIAQSEASTGKRFVNYWMHGEFLNEDSGKMSKSKGETLTLSYLERQGFTPTEYRFLLLQAHYRSMLTFSFEALRSAQVGYRGLIAKLQEWKDLDPAPEVKSVAGKKLLEDFDHAVYTDLNLPEALALVFKVVKEPEIPREEKLRLIDDFDGIYGLDLLVESRKIETLPESVLLLVRQRDEARARKNFAESDRLRDELQALGYRVDDSLTGTKISKS